MADQNLPGMSPAANPAALQLRASNALSTYVLPPAIAVPADDDEAIHLRDLWRVIVKRKWVVMAVFLIVVITALVVTMMATPVYRATITLKIEREASKIIDFKGAPSVPEEYGDVDFYRTQYELLKSRTLAERVVKQLDLRQRNVATLEKKAPWWSPWWPAGLSEWWSSVTSRAPDARAKVEGDASPADVARSASEAAVGAFMGSLTVEPVRSSGPGPGRLPVARSTRQASQPPPSATATPRNSSPRSNAVQAGTVSCSPPDAPPRPEAPAAPTGVATPKANVPEMRSPSCPRTR